MIKQSIKSLLASPVGWRLSAPLRRPGLIVIMYHRINRGHVPFFGLPVEVFRQQVRWLKQNCRVIAPDEIEDALDTPRAVRPAVLITFDDGFKDYHDNAYPVLDEFQVPAVVFVATHFLDHGGMIWTDVLHYCALRSRKRAASLPWLPGREFDLQNDEQRAAFVSAGKRHLKSVADESRVALLGTLLDELGAQDPDCREIDRQMLNWQEVAAVRRQTTIGGHTHTHPILSQVSIDRAEQEIRVCHQRITAETGSPPRLFAYPNGRAADYTPEVSGLVRKQGFDLAFATAEGINSRETDPMALRRQPGDASSIGDFARLLSTPSHA